jgi:23S rRNA (cytosine1962-C5)-methyltransferase
LDSGRFRKLEQVGPYILERPSPQAVWLPSQNEKVWAQKHAWFERNATGGGQWHFSKNFPKSWHIEWDALTLKIQPTGFGHFGLFPEQKGNISMLRGQIQKSSQPLEILNLFAYTGVLTLIAAQAGAQVCHVDAAKGVVDWARENARLSGLEKKNIRWIVEDVQQFLKREIKRGKTYDGVILDPPSFGRGPNKELWNIETHLTDFLDLLKKVFSKNFKFLILSAHSEAYTPLALQNLLRGILPEGCFECFEMVTPEASPPHRPLPSGACCRWSRV